MSSTPANAPGHLQTYREKRDFRRTPEPSGVGEHAADDALRFVIQRHRARRLHYDFRLEIDGVLVSWAVPKGVSRDPKSRHLAVHVEDHPLDYIDFEGIIPEGEYGGGDVIVWDRGTWEPHGTDDPRAAVEAGELHAELFGEKLAGRVVLIRTRGDRGKDNWLVLHKNDNQAIPGWDPEQYPRSVVSGRTNDEVAEAPTRKWTRTGEVPIGPGAFAGPNPEELEALDALKSKGRWQFQGRELTLTNLDKVLFPGRDREPAVTKRDLIRHYSVIAPVMLPYLADRPLNLPRYPDGVERKGFWQKEAPAYAPDWIRRWQNDDADASESQFYLLADEPATLAWLANHGAVEVHPWTSQIPSVREPTYALIDLDPGTTTTTEELLVLARLHRTALEHLGVRGYPKVTGQRGLQIWIPIRPGPTFDETRAWTEQLSRAIGETAPDLVSWNWEKRDRRGLARLDYTQNAINKTLVAPYSTRPAAGAPVSVPITWDELDDPGFAADRWTVSSVMARLAAQGDPMAPMLNDRQDLPTLT
jgi:bifunctional non-homologous end joining protein LigD